MEIIEKWLPILGYEGRYKISNYGRVKSLERSEFMPWNNGTRLWKEKIMNAHVKDNEYLFVTLYNGEGRKGLKQKYIHRLVAEVFKRTLIRGDVINHIDKNRQNNFDGNIEILTQRENCLYTQTGRNKTSKYPGVYLFNKKWVAMAREKKGEKKYLGRFTTEEDAFTAYSNFVKSLDIETKYLPTL